MSLYDQLKTSLRGTSQLLYIPRFSLEISRQNFVYNGSAIWNAVIGLVLEKCVPHSSNVIIPGSSINSDLSASIAAVKNKLKKYLMDIQKSNLPCRPNEWLPSNFMAFGTN